MTIINLSYPIYGGMFKYPSDPEPLIDITPATMQQISINVGNLNRTVYTNRYKSGFTTFILRSHHGTHIDTPAHKIPNEQTIDFYHEDRFRNSCALIDLTNTDLLERTPRSITVKDLESVINKEDYSQIKSAIIYTGFCNEMERNNGKLAGQEKTDFEKNFPFLLENAANYLLNLNQKLNILGIDSFSFDPQGSNSEVHRIFFSNSILLLETLYNLKTLNEELKKRNQTIFDLWCVFYPCKGFDAVNTTALAILEDE